LGYRPQDDWTEHVDVPEKPDELTPDDRPKDS